jgi:hypothetical protein
MSRAPPSPESCVLNSSRWRGIVTYGRGHASPRGTLVTARRLDWQRGRNGSWMSRLLTGRAFTRLGPTLVVGLLLALFLILPAGAAGSGPSPDPAPHRSPQKASASSDIKAATNEPVPDAAPRASRGPQPSPAPGSGDRTTASQTVTPVSSGGSRGGELSRTQDVASSSIPITRAPSVSATPAAASRRVASAAKHRATPPSNGASRKRPPATGHTFPTSLLRRLDLFRPATSALSSLTRHDDGTLVLLSALAMLVLLIASSSLLRLLARSRGEGWEG